MQPTTLQYLILILNGGMLLAMCKGLLMLGRFLEKVETHDRSIEALWKNYGELNSRLFGVATHGEKH